MQDFYPLFALNPQPMLVYHIENGLIGLANEAMQQTYGYSQEELSQMDLIDLEADMPHSTLSFLSQAYETTHQRKDGSFLQVEVTIKDLTLEGEEVQLILIRDVTAYKKQAEELRLAKHRAEEASRAKELFLASVSHEIRTPMNAIMGMTYLLAKTDLAPIQKNYNDTIRVSAENLLVIINDILDMSKITAGKMTLENVGFRLSESIQNLCNTIRYRAEEKGIGLFTEIDRRIAPILLGDPLRLYQVLLNLVSNAIKFTEKGQVEIECSLVKSYPSSQQIEFKVIDSGKGIDKDKLEKIFEAFAQEDETVSREYGGTGLGLSISKNLVQLFGGKLDVQSTKSTGTTFSFILEMGVGEEEDIPQKEQDIGKAQIQKSLEGLRVLLVEDHDINAFVATSIMAQWNIKPDLATNGKEAIRMIRQNQYDVVLMDIQMPIMGGVEATKIIRKDLKSEVPIVALTANAIRTDIEKYLSAGMNDHVSKPFEPNHLLKTILSVTNFHFTMNKSYDLPKLRELFSNNEAMVRKMLMLFVNSTPPLIIQIQEAQKMERYKEVSQVIHKIKSSVKTLGAVELGELCQKLESYASEPDASPIRINEMLQEALSKIQHLLQEIQQDLQ
jgi:PAS domain S-box-containing protein